MQPVPPKGGAHKNIPGIHQVTCSFHMHQSDHQGGKVNESPRYVLPEAPPSLVREADGRGRAEYLPCALMEEGTMW